MFDIEILQKDEPSWVHYNYVFKKVDDIYKSKPRIFELDQTFDERKPKYKGSLSYYRAYALEDNNLYFGWTKTGTNWKKYSTTYVGGWYLVDNTEGKKKVLCPIEVNANRRFPNIIKSLLAKNRKKVRAQILYYVLKMGFIHQQNAIIEYNLERVKKEKGFRTIDHPVVLFHEDSAMQQPFFVFNNPFYNTESAHFKFKLMELLESLEYHNNNNWNAKPFEINLDLK